MQNLLWEIQSIVKQPIQCYNITYLNSDFSKNSLNNITLCYTINKLFINILLIVNKLTNLNYRMC